MKKCKGHNVASNSPELWGTLVGHSIAGVLHDVRFGCVNVKVVLVLDCGKGLVLNSNGSFWMIGSEEVKIEIESKRRALKNTQEELRAVIQLAGCDAR